MSWPVAAIVMGHVPGVGRSYILVGRADDHVPRPAPELPPYVARRRAAAKARRARKVEAGYCSRCCARPAKPGCVTCRECLDKTCEAIERRRATRPQGECSSCARHEARPGKKTCQRCADDVQRCKGRRNTSAGR
jgi:hypothetical protein